MILDTLDQASTYHALSPRFAAAFAFLRTVNERTTVGRHEIAGDDIYAFVQQHATTPVEKRVYESHRRYIDIQYMVRGRELMYWAPLPLLKTVTMPFDAEKDAALYALIPEGVPVRVTPGQFAIFFPEDGHIPSCSWDAPAEILKVVVKVRV
ncbi:MAG TPA: YhcH/YjgK/YiaL family protein [Opitutaceae bacterium]|nr:YhcH/YjgK/YiaL family protein [Opitutaceae bacterium]HND60699.1 YhcH/YjgK/YiaL family protein [Opitutaceae bacterium]